MKSSRIIALLILIISAVILSIPIFVKHIDFEYQIEPYAPIEKAYGNMVINYKDLYVVKNAKNPEFKERSITDSRKNEWLETTFSDEKMQINSRLDFVDRTRKTRIKIKEEIKFDSWIEHAFGVLFSSSVYEQRERFYINLEQSIESTPDGSLIPGELK